jgi:hypothetical protein
MLGMIEVVPASSSRAHLARSPQPVWASGRSAGDARRRRRRALHPPTARACHGAAGAGIAGAFPPLAGHAAELANSRPRYLIDSLLYGLQGEITVRGATYAASCRPGRTSATAQLAAILDHIVGLGGPDVAPFAPTRSPRGAAWRWSRGRAGLPAGGDRPMTGQRRRSGVR